MWRSPPAIRSSSDCGACGDHPGVLSISSVEVRRSSVAREQATGRDRALERPRCHVRRILLHRHDLAVLHLVWTESTKRRLAALPSMTLSRDGTLVRGRIDSAHPSQLDAAVGLIGDRASFGMRALRSLADLLDARYLPPGVHGTSGAFRRSRSRSRASRFRPPSARRRPRVEHDRLRGVARGAGRVRGGDRGGCAECRSRRSRGARAGDLAGTSRRRPRCACPCARASCDSADRSRARAALTDPCRRVGC
jgi:hypothetical protein